MKKNSSEQNGGWKNDEEDPILFRSELWVRPGSGKTRNGSELANRFRIFPDPADIASDLDEDFRAPAVGTELQESAKLTPANERPAAVDDVTTFAAIPTLKIIPATFFGHEFVK